MTDSPTTIEREQEFQEAIEYCNAAASLLLLLYGRDIPFPTDFEVTDYHITASWQSGDVHVTVVRGADPSAGWSVHRWDGEAVTTKGNSLLDIPAKLAELGVK